MHAPPFFPPLLSFSFVSIFTHPPFLLGYVRLCTSRVCSFILSPSMIHLYIHPPPLVLCSRPLTCPPSFLVMYSLPPASLRVLSIALPSFFSYLLTLQFDPIHWLTSPSFKATTFLLLVIHPPFSLPCPFPLPPKRGRETATRRKEEREEEMLVLGRRCCRCCCCSDK